MRIDRPPTPALREPAMEKESPLYQAAEGMEAQFTAGLRKVVVEDAGHFLQLEQPDRVAEEVISFIKSGH